MNQQLQLEVDPRFAQLIFERGANAKLTHNLFRFPAKSHPPVIRELIDRFVEPGCQILDPFCGSGTVLIEAARAGNPVIGSDVDPLAVFVSRAKSNPIDPVSLAKSWEALQAEVFVHRRSSGWYADHQKNDIPEEQLRRDAVDIPEIPNLAHWFRRYVVVDLSKIRRAIEATHMPEPHRRFFLLCFASVIRNASNADPVPVSGLEVTAHMLRLEAAGRTIDPFSLFARAVTKAMRAMEEYWRELPGGSRIHVVQADATRLRSRLRRVSDATLTSPPYHGAVDYYRRHQLEMFWLRLTTSHSDRLALLPQYIGRPKVAKSDAALRGRFASSISASVEVGMRSTDPARANAFKHYCVTMSRVFKQLARSLRQGAPAVFIVGHSSWNGVRLATSDLFAELAAPEFQLQELLWYPIKNRYMSYDRHNGASIDREYVVVMRRS